MSFQNFVGRIVNTAVLSPWVRPDVLAPRHPKRRPSMILALLAYELKKVDIDGFEMLNN